MEVPLADAAPLPGRAAAHRRVAALYDIHGHLPALDAVLADVAAVGVDAVVVGGDVVPGPMPRECLDRLRALDVPVHWLHGNGEHDVLEAAAGGPLSRVPTPYRGVVRWSAEVLGPTRLVEMTAWPDSVTLHVAALGDVLFCHATPERDDDLFTALTDEARLVPVFAGVAADVVVCGHTHLPFDRQVGRVRVVNAGSVGMPFGDPRASWVLIGPTVEPRLVPYDRHAGAAVLRATSYPQVDDFVVRYVLDTPDATTMQATFARAELASRNPRR